MLLANKADVNYIDYNNRNAVTSAAESGNIDIVNMILSHDGLYIELVYDALHDPLCSGSSNFYLSTEIAKLLISRLPDVNCRVQRSCVLLNHAVSGRYLGMISLLLESGADPNVTDSSGVDALFIACSEGYLDIVRQLFEFDSSHKISMESINKAYLCACYFGRVDMVRYLIEKGADINAVGGDGGPAIDYAIHKNNIPLAKLLIEKGLDVNAIYLSRSALYFACMLMYDEMLQLLFDSGADPDLRYPDGSTLLLNCIHITCDKRADYTPYIALLLTHGADVNMSYGLTGMTILMIATFASAKNDLVELLLEHGADPNVHRSDGSCLLLNLIQLTCEKRTDYTTYITFLLDREANVNISHSATGQTALMIAGAAANTDLVKLLLEHGADVTQFSREGKGVMDMLGRTRSHAKVAELCEAYIDSNRVDSKAILK